MRRTLALRLSAMTSCSQYPGKNTFFYHSAPSDLTRVRYDEEQQDKADLTKQMQHFPAGTSARTIVHTAQNIQQGRKYFKERKYFRNFQGKFQAFDWGSAGNLERYGANSPPQVNLATSTPAQALYLPPSNDFLVQPGDFNRLIQASGDLFF